MRALRTMQKHANAVMFLCFNQEARKREKKTLECWAAAAILLQTSLLEYIDFTDYTASSRR